MKKSAPDYCPSKGNFFPPVDQFTKDQLLKKALFFSIAAMKCDEYFVNFVKNTTIKKDSKRRK
jgi:hypothetical protein